MTLGKCRPASAAAPVPTARVDVKVVLLGREYCGKTSLAERFVNQRYISENRYQNTIGAAYAARRMDVAADGADASLSTPTPLTLGVWDTAGSERYESMSRIYYRGARAAVLCYDVTQLDSWEKVRFWLAELRRFEPECRAYVCATKVDLVRADKTRRCIDYHETTDFCEEHDATLFETSSKTGEGVEELFLKIAKDFVNDPKHFLTEFDRMINLDHKTDVATQRRGCCS